MNLLRYHINAKEFKCLCITILLAFCGSISTDIHLASLPAIMQYMHTTKQHMQQSVTIFFLGVGLSILIYGPLSDRLGRKPIVIFGMIMACIASFSSAWSTHIGSFLMWRFLQGVGSGVCWGLGRIIVADILQDERLAAIGSYFSLFLQISPLIAPVLGSYIQHAFGWQANFIVLGGLFFIVLMVFIFFFEESHRHRSAKAFNLLSLFKTYRQFFHHRCFVGCIMLTGLAMSANIIYTTTSPFIFQHQFHTSPIIFGWLTALTAVAGIVGKLMAPWLIKCLQSKKTLIIGICLLLCSGIFLSTCIIFFNVNIPIVLIGVALASIALSLISGITMSMALSPFHQTRGSAGALYGSFQLMIAFSIGALVSRFPHLGTTTLAMSYVVLGVLAFTCFQLALKK